MQAKKTKQEVAVQYCEHLLKTLISNVDGPKIWTEGVMKTVRECVHTINSHPDRFPYIVGDHMPDGSMFIDNEQRGGKMPALTNDYIAAISECRALDFDEYPVLQIVAKPKRHFEETTNSGKTSNTHFTHLRLCDGSNDVITGRLSMHLSHEGK